MIDLALLGTNDGCFCVIAEEESFFLEQDNTSEFCYSSEKMGTHIYDTQECAWVCPPSCLGDEGNIKNSQCSNCACYSCNIELFDFNCGGQLPDCGTCIFNDM